MSTDPPATMFMNFFGEKYLLAMDKHVMVIPTCLLCAQVKHMMGNEKFANRSLYYTYLCVHVVLVVNSAGFEFYLYTFFDPLPPVLTHS